MDSNSLSNQLPPLPKARSLFLLSTFPKCFFLIIAVLITTVIFLQIHSINTALPFSLSISLTSSFPLASTPHFSNQVISMLRQSITFLPLKDSRLSNHPMDGNTWFMSSVSDSSVADGEPIHIRIPSSASNGRLLCLSAADHHDGARNSYALAFREALPENSSFLPGRTFVADNYYDYDNIWHGHAAIAPFARWHATNGGAAPSRWVLFHFGEVRTNMSEWVRTLAEVSTGAAVSIGEMGGTVACFEEAVVMRRSDGGMGKEKREAVYDMMRCRARAFCNVKKNSGEEEEDGDRRSSSLVRMTLLFRVGSRSFKNETAVAGVFERECRQVVGCRVRLVRSINLTFCEQVQLMSETDILVSPHGAQMTNMVFMDKNSSVMEFFPKGWLELAGAGQYVYRWLADWAGMRHEGQWRDSDGDSCPFDDKDLCFTFYKDGSIGHDEVFFSRWAARVIRETKEQKQQDLRGSLCDLCSSCG